MVALAPGRGYVLGNRGGAWSGLGRVGGYPGGGRALVAHEPPWTRLLDDADEHARFAREVHDTYLSEGVGAAMGKFLASAGLDGGPPQPPAGPTPEMAAAMVRMERNFDFFLGHMWLVLSDYAPDVSRLRSLPITVAVGEASEGQLAYRAVVLAERLGKNSPSSPVTTAGSVATQELSPGASTRCSATTERRLAHRRALPLFPWLTFYLQMKG